MPGSSELAEVQEKLELLNIEYDRLNDEWKGRLAAQEDEFQREKHVREFVQRCSCTHFFTRWQMYAETSQDRIMLDY